MSLCYFAYGSNLLTKRLKKRCPRAVSKERAYADDWTVKFSKPSKDCSGKATLSPKNGCRTPGMLFEIPDSEVCCLDKSEGVGYERCDSFCVRLAESGKIVPVATYLATFTKPDLKPYDWYLALVIARRAGAHTRRKTITRCCIRWLTSATHVVIARNGAKRKRFWPGVGYPDYRCLLNPGLCESAT